MWRGHAGATDDRITWPCCGEPERADDTGRRRSSENVDAWCRHVRLDLAPSADWATRAEARHLAHENIGEHWIHPQRKIRDRAIRRADIIFQNREIGRHNCGRGNLGLNSVYCAAR